MRGDGRSNYSDDDRLEMRNKLADVRAFFKDRVNNQAKQERARCVRQGIIMKLDDNAAYLESVAKTLEKLDA